MKERFPPKVWICRCYVSDTLFVRDDPGINKKSYEAISVIEHNSIVSNLKEALEKILHEGNMATQGHWVLDTDMIKAIAYNALVAFDQQSQSQQTEEL